MLRNVINYEWSKIVMATQERESTNTKYRGNHYNLSLSTTSNNAKSGFVALGIYQFRTNGYEFYSHVATNGASNANINKNNCVVWRFRRKKDYINE